MKSYLALLILLLNSTLVYAELIPIEQFAKHAKYEDAVISPTGKYLAVTMRNDESKYMVAVLRTKDMKVTAVMPPAAKQEIFNPVWVTDERIVVQLAERWGDLDTPRANGELIAINANGKKRKALTQHRRTFSSNSASYYAPKNDLQGHSKVIHNLPKDPKHILIEYYPFGVAYKEKKSSAYKLNIFNSKAKRVAVAPSALSNFITDADGNIVYSAGLDTTTNDLLIHKFNDGEWALTDTIKDLGVGTKPLAAISGSNEIIVEKTQESGPSKIYTLNVETQKHRLIYKHNSVDYRRLITDRKTNQPIAIHFDPDYPDLTIVDSDHPIGQWYPALYQAFGGKRVVITSSSDDYKTLVLHVSSDKEPGQFHLFDTEKKKLKFILAAKPKFETDKLASSEPFKFKTSDGVILHGYLTKPEESTKKLPLVVLPHGGPHGLRDYWQYSDDVQLIASRGYAVLQVNFRGSGGYGESFQGSGYMHWGDLIQQDIIEATQWALKNQPIDAKRVCIFGVSFGAYSALMAPTLAPELFQCAIGYAGLYDLNLWLDDSDVQKMNFGETYLKDAIGNNKDLLNKFSPTQQASKLKIPVFLAHGEEDERTPDSQFHAMKRALKNVNNPAETFLVAGEGHGFYQEKNRQEFYERLLAFLDKHIGDNKIASK